VFIKISTAMTGRFGNRKSGRGGRGRGRGGPTQTKTKKMVEDYFFYVGSSKHASDYEITAEFVVKSLSHFEQSLFDPPQKILVFDPEVKKNSRSFFLN
jgi:hypothetical protein